VIELAEIEAARARIAGSVVRTPLVRLHAEGAPADIYLKLENLQPVNSFKIRGATNAIMLAPASASAKGLVTASAGNMAQGIAWMARELGVPATIVVPDHAPEAKVAAIERLGGQVLKLPYDDWWNVIITSHLDGMEGLFVHPVQDPGVMAGNGTIGLEILDDLPDPDAVVIPYGGGGLTAGIASAVKALRPGTKIITAEPETAAALVAALAAGHPADVDYRASFVDGSGSRRVLDSMWPLVAPLVDDALAIPVADVAAAVRTLAERVRVIAEGAGALAPAAALSGRAGTGKVVCVVSGGNINLSKLAEILGGAAGLPAAFCPVHPVMSGAPRHVRRTPPRALSSRSTSSAVL
jgi:threonine dehydratase